MSESTIDLPVLGMTCAACVRRVEKAALAAPGVTAADVNLPLSRVRIVLDDGAGALPAIDAIRKAGYEVPADALEATPRGEMRLASIERAHREEASALRRDAIIAIVATVPLLVIAMSHGLIGGAGAVIAQLALGTLVVLGPGSRYIRAGVRAVVHRSPDMNTLIALGAGAAWLSSTIVAARWLVGARAGEPALYFEAGAAIVAFVMVGKVLEARARAHLADAVRGLVALAPAIAHTRDGDVDAAALVPGDVICVRPGERIAADGTVIEGRSAVDEALLTGEGMPVDKAEGAPVYAGTLNHHGALTVRVARAGRDTSLARIARLVEDAQGSKAPIARLADRVSAYFVPVVLAIAGATLGLWLLVGGTAAIAVERMVAVLVIACPCALGLATPAAVAVGTARGAQLGVLFRTAGALEAASTIEVACFDKTGTLTTGKPALIGVMAIDDRLLAFAAAAEQASEHPIARAIVEAARELAIPSARDVVTTPGGGVTAVVENVPVQIGSLEFLALSGIAVPAEDRFPGATLCHVAIDARYAGVIAVADPPASEARATVAQLREMHIDSIMITGDRLPAAQWIAREVGIDRIHAGVRPNEKASLVAAERRKVAMIGDGVNDAPALACADLGVVLGTGTEIAAASADVTLLRGGIGSLPTVFALARATLRTIRRNLVAASIYNVVCIPVAAAGLLSPVLASAAMSLSSVTVLVSSLRLRNWQRK